MFSTASQLLHTIYDVRGLIEWGGTLSVCVIVFVETGLFVGFFLPGDSLLVTAGIFAAARVLNVTTLVPLVVLCAIVGDQFGYWIVKQWVRCLENRRRVNLGSKRTRSCPSSLCWPVWSHSKGWCSIQMHNSR